MIGWFAVVYGLAQIMYTQPLWAGAGVEYNRIAAPARSGLGGVTGVSQGVVISRINTDIAIADFTDDVRALGSAERARIVALGNDAASQLRAAGARPGVTPAGDPAVNVYERLWARPNLTVIALDAHPLAGSSNQIVAAATARLSFRLAPGQDPQRGAATVLDHITRHVPHGLETTTHVHEAVPAWTCEPDGPAFAACERALEAGFGVSPRLMGIGGSVPFVGPFVAAFGGIPALLVGPEDPHSHAHGEDESLHLDDWRKLIESEIHLLAELGALGRVGLGLPPA